MRGDSVGKFLGTHAAGAPEVDVPDIVVDRRIDIALADDAGAVKFLWLEKRISAKAIADARTGRFRVGGYGRNLGASDVVVEGKVLDGEVLQGSRDGFARRVGGNLDIADVGIVGVLRPEAEVPHHLGRDLRIVGVEQREGKASDVVGQFPALIKLYLRGIFFGRGLVRRWPFEAIGRDDLHPHPLFDQREVTGAHQIVNRLSVFGRNEVAGLDGRGIGWNPHQREQHREKTTENLRREEIRISRTGFHVPCLLEVLARGAAAPTASMSRTPEVYCMATLDRKPGDGKPNPDEWPVAAARIATILSGGDRQAHSCPREGGSIAVQRSARPGGPTMVWQKAQERRDTRVART